MSGKSRCSEGGRRTYTNIKTYLRNGAIDFFFSSRRRHTIFDCDWSSDVCSSDLSSPPYGLRSLVQHENLVPKIRPRRLAHQGTRCAMHHLVNDDRLFRRRMWKLPSEKSFVVVDDRGAWHCQHLTLPRRSRGYLPQHESGRPST